IDRVRRDGHPGSSRGHITEDRGEERQMTVAVQAHHARRFCGTARRRWAELREGADNEILELRRAVFVEEHGKEIRAAADRALLDVPAPARLEAGGRDPQPG